MRLEVQSGNPGVVLQVSGPGPLGSTHAFSSADALEEFRAGLEHDLLVRGFRLLAVAERRSGHNRRQTPRPDSRDRRRA